ncbi:MAG: choice-of-anchor D domain-containing protein [Calditrichota bacterium]
MRIFIVLMALTVTAFSQVNSSNVTWKSSVDQSFITTILANDNQLYSMIGNLPNFSTRSLKRYDISVPVLTSTVQNFSYSAPNGSKQLVLIGDSILYRNYTDVDFFSSFFRIYDINNGLLVPRAQRLVGSMGGFTQMVDFPGEDYLFCTNNFGSLEAFDVSDPYMPTISIPGGSHRFFPNPMAFVKGYLYSSSTSQISIYQIELSSPINLTLLNQVPTPAVVNSFRVLGNTLYTAVGQAGIVLFDITDPLNPTFIGSYNTPDNALDVDVDHTGTLVYVADNSSLQILDASDPSNIELNGYHLGIPAIGVESNNRTIIAQEQYNIGILRSNYGESGSLTFAEPNRLIIGVEGGGPLSRPAAIHNNGQSTITVNGFSTEGTEFAVSDTSFSIAPGEEKFVDVTFINPGVIGIYEGLLMIDHSGSQSPDTLLLTGEVEPEYLFPVHDAIPNTFVGNTNFSEIRLWNNGVYNLTVDSITTTGESFHIDSINGEVLAPANVLARQIAFSPIAAGQQTTTVKIYYQGAEKTLNLTGTGVGPSIQFPSDTLQLQDTYIGRTEMLVRSLKNTGNFGFEIFTVDFPAPPFQATLNGMTIAPGDSLTLSVNFTPQQSQTFSDSIVFEHNLSSSPTVIYLTGEGITADASNMVLVGGLNTPGQAKSLSIENQTAFLADSDNGILAINVSDPQNIFISSELTLSEPLNSIEVLGPVGYAVAENGIFYTLNLADPTAISLYDDLPLPGTPNDIALQGLYAYVSAGSEGLRIINIADPSTPIQFSFLGLPGFASGVAVAGSYVYVACGNNGLQVVDITNLFTPFIAATLSLPGSANELLKDGNRLFVSLGISGVQEVDITNPLQPQAIRLIDTIGESVDLAQSGDTLYVAALENGIRAHNLSPANAPEFAYYRLADENVSSLWALGETVYAAAGNSGLFILKLGEGVVGTGETPATAPITEFKLHQNYPNPFNPETRIGFDLPQRSSVELVVYDLLGRKVRTLKSGTLPAGGHQATWNGQNDAGQSQVSGVYVYQLQYETEAGKRGSLSGKMVLLK